MGYPIKQIAEMAGLTTRTLRHFDQIGLLQPRRDGRNHYRNYEQDDILRLQQILGNHPPWIQVSSATVII